MKLMYPIHSRLFAGAFIVTLLATGWTWSKSYQSDRAPNEYVTVTLSRAKAELNALERCLRDTSLTSAEVVSCVQDVAAGNKVRLMEESGRRTNSAGDHVIDVSDYDGSRESLPKH